MGKYRPPKVRFNRASWVGCVSPKTVAFPHTSAVLCGPTTYPMPGGKKPPATTKIEAPFSANERSEEHTSELQSRLHLVCRLLLEKKKKKKRIRLSKVTSKNIAASS